MWADQVTIQVGAQRVGVRAEDPDVAALVRKRFAASLVDGEVPAAFSLRRPGADAASATGARPLGLLYWGSCIVGRAAEPGRLLDTLAGWFARIETLQGWDGPTMYLRMFERDGAVVLVDLAAPALVDDRRLASRGVREVPGDRVPVRFEAGLVADGRPVRGVVLVDPTPSAARALARLMAVTTPEVDEAFGVFAALVAAGRTRVVTTVDDARAAVVDLLG